MLMKEIDQNSRLCTLLLRPIPGRACTDVFKQNSRMIEQRLSGFLSSSMSMEPIDTVVDTGFTSFAIELVFPKTEEKYRHALYPVCEEKLCRCSTENSFNEKNKITGKEI